MSDEKTLKKTINMTAFALILNLALFLASEFALDAVLYLMDTYGTALSDTLYYVIYDLCDITLYALAFFIPAIILARSCGDIPRCRGDIFSGCVSIALPAARHPLCIILGALGMLQAAGIASNSLLNFFYSFGFDISTDYTQYVPQTAPEIITLFLSLVIIPAVFEELLFRGVILSRLARFGPTFAIIVSGVLFGLMHCSTSQFFYAVTAGIILAYIAVGTGSIWLTIFIHMLNNLISFAFVFIDAYAGYSADVVIWALLSTLLLGGGLIAALRIARDDSQTPGGLISHYGEPQYSVKPNILVRKAFSPIMIIYVIFTVIVLISRFLPV